MVQLPQQLTLASPPWMFERWTVRLVPLTDAS